MRESAASLDLIAEVLLRVVKQKDTASYQGIYYTIGEARALMKDLERFADWADEIYEQR